MSLRKTKEKTGGIKQGRSKRDQRIWRMMQEDKSYPAIVNTLEKEGFKKAKLRTVKSVGKRIAKEEGFVKKKGRKVKAKEDKVEIKLSDFSYEYDTQKREGSWIEYNRYIKLDRTPAGQRVKLGKSYKLDNNKAISTDYKLTLDGKTYDTLVIMNMSADKKFRFDFSKKIGGHFARSKKVSGRKVLPILKLMVEAKDNKTALKVPNSVLREMLKSIKIEKVKQ